MTCVSTPNENIANFCKLLPEIQITVRGNVLARNHPRKADSNR
jgi:hypothetical protein